MARPKILIVEDEALIAMELEDTLKRMSYEIAGSASNSEAVFRRVEVSRPDVVLMDVRIKGPRDGIETAEELRSRFGIRVIYMTAYTDEETRRRAMATGPLAHLSKPFDDEALRAAIESALREQGADA